MSLYKVLESSRTLRGQFNDRLAISATLYIEHYKDISAMLRCLGMVFSFVTKEIDAKIAVLENHIEARGLDTLDEMVLFEIENGCTNTNKPKSASRTLLRLHRALEFIHQFLERLYGLQSKESAVPAAQSAYKATLSHHHPWVIRQTVHVALKTLDNKDTLIQRLSADHGPGDAEMVKALCDDMKTIWTHIQKMYDTHKLHGLP